MGWEITNFVVDDAAGMAKPFQFEISFYGNRTVSDRLVRGDGIIMMKSGKVRINRATDLMRTVAEQGFEPAEFIDKLANRIVGDNDASVSVA